MELQVGVKVLLFNKNKEFLVVKRSSVKYPDVKNPWDIVGGRINPGTNLVENLKREVREETRLELSSDPVLLKAQDIIIKDKNRHVVRLTFIAKTEGNPILDEENTEYKWLKLQEIKEFEGLDEYLREVLKDDVIHETCLRLINNE
jgi:ADP-ribose pyrophosphatase YjhB (NUDIX family)